MYTCYIQSFKTLASFCSWAGWFVSYLVENPGRHIFAWCGSFYVESCLALCVRVAFFHSRLSLWSLRFGSWFVCFLCIWFISYALTSFFSSSWRRGLTADCDCGTPLTFLLAFLHQSAETLSHWSVIHNCFTVTFSHIINIVNEDHMLDWHSCQICYPLEIKLFIIIITGNETINYKIRNFSRPAKLIPLQLALLTRQAILAVNHNSISIEYLLIFKNINDSLSCSLTVGINFTYMHANPEEHFMYVASNVVLAVRKTSRINWTNPKMQKNSFFNFLTAHVFVAHYEWRNSVTLWPDNSSIHRHSDENVHVSQKYSSPSYEI